MGLPQIEILGWEDPPPQNTRGSSGAYERVVAALRKKPGKWAVVREVAKKTAASGMGSYFQYVKTRLPGCEVVSRTQGDVTRIYARWPE